MLAMDRSQCRHLGLDRMVGADKSRNILLTSFEKDLLEMSLGELARLESSNSNSLDGENENKVFKNAISVSFRTLKSLFNGFQIVVAHRRRKMCR